MKKNGNQLHIWMAVSAIILLGLMLYFSQQEERKETRLKPVLKNKQITLKSFQATDIQQRQKIDHSKPSQRNPASNDKTISNFKQHFTENNNERSKDSHTGSSSDTNLTINGVSYFAIKNKYARKIESQDASFPEEATTRISGLANGYVLIDASPIQREFLEYRKDCQIIVSDKWGVEKYIISGAIVVKATSSNDFEKIAAMTQLDIIYRAPHIATVILQARNGQNLNNKIEELKKNQKVIRATLEILGKGDEQK